MKKILQLILLLGLAFVFIACDINGDSGDDSDTDDSNGVYVAGYITNSDDITVAVYWKDGDLIELTDGTSDAEARAIAVDGDDVYVVGYESDKGVYWKNGTEIELEDGEIAYSIAIDDGDVYIAGNATGGNRTIAAYWKNDSIVKLTDGTNYAYAYSVAVDGDDVYVAGYEYISSDTGAVYWKNGTEVELEDGEKARSIAVDDGDIYVAGDEWNEDDERQLTYWINGTVYDDLVSGKSYALSIVVNEGDLYIAGYRSNAPCLAEYWKNGTGVQLGTYNSELYSIVIDDGSVFAAGYEADPSKSYNNVAKYWKDGIETELSDGETDAIAYSIVVISD